MKKIFFLLLVVTMGCRAQSTFTIVPLGIKGGTDESNLSSYAVAATGTNNYACLDAGTLHAGIQKAIVKKTFRGDATAWLRKNVKGYLISHPHFDHVAGLIINAPEDTSKYIYGLESCLSVLKDKHFSWRSWANFANEGEKPTLNKYTYQTLTPGIEVEIKNTSLYATPFVLSHVSPNESTAFLVRSGDRYVLYLGDTGADRIEKSTRLRELWQAVGPLIRDRKLKAIFIEVSFSNEQTEGALFGHLTPKLLTEELVILSAYCGKEALKDFPIVITHIKPHQDREQKVKKQLADLNTLGVIFEFPEQGKAMEF
jgi:cAMP phosphodiesterase